MAFLSKIWLPAVVLFILANLVQDVNPHESWARALGSIALVWLIVDVPVTIVYVVVRIFRRASRDAEGAR